MYNYMVGKVTDTEGTSIILEVQGIGYSINTPNPFQFDLNQEYKVYLYQYIREDENSLYGFKTKEEKEMFLKLIGVKGLGPKMALPILATGSISGIVDAIERENILYLKKFPKIGEKLAKQIILDLKGKISITGLDTIESNNYEELVEVLKGLGYKEKDVKGIIVKVDSNLPIEEQVKEALKLLMK
ncbi:MAG: Holliday junction branch migration protein RuvA [Firmicutes bacterium]|nr:Holliday junction branch migration protein RuvA [Bacillota bacterium]